MSVARRFSAALAVVGLGVLAYAVPASATGGDAGEACITNPTADDLVANLYPFKGIARVRAKDGVTVCADVLLSIYKVPDTWTGGSFNESATPQTLIASDAGTIGEGKLELTVPVPDCGNLQIDLYFPPEITTVTFADHHGGRLIQGKIWKTWDGAGNLKPCAEGSPTPTATPTTASPTPTATPTTASPTPTATPTTAVPAPSVTPTTEVPTPSETPVSTPAAPPTRPVVVVPVTVLPPPAGGGKAPPVLAETGTDSTVPLLGLGLALLGAGLGLSLLGRRRPTG